MSKNLKLITSITLVVIAVVIAKVLIATAPKAEKKRPPKMAVLVQTTPLVQTNQTVILHQTGTVTPSEDIWLQARVSGEVISINREFIEGGRLKKDETILTIDPTDYALARADAESRLEKARADHKLELGRQDVARREWELLHPEEASERERELALRIPHLAASQAALDAAKAALEKANLNLARTQIRAPFNAVVLERKANIGSQISLQDQIARLVGTDAYWVTASIPVDRLKWVSIPGSKVTVLAGNGVGYEGTVIKLLSNLEQKGRMARLLIDIKDPLEGEQPLLLGAYVHTQIEGRQLNRVFSIPRSALRENSTIWLATNGTLDIRTVKVLWRDSKHVLIRDGLADGELLITSDIPAPIPGMKVNTENSKPAETGK